ncbi:MAG: bacterioferritin [Methylacidiphilales bacterium]|nr:bacterioferritin [Candidatus Methylacidiphilales bacterium]
MIVCSCNVLSDHDIRAAAGNGATVRTVGDVYRTLGGCDGQCRRCARSIKAVLDEVKGAGCDECLAVCGERVTDTSHPPHHPAAGTGHVALLQAAE